jgi:hypothetical protein
MPIRSNDLNSYLKLIVAIFAISILAAIFIPRSKTDAPSGSQIPSVTITTPPQQQAPTQKPEPPKPTFDILSVDQSELPKTTKLTEAVDFSIAGGTGSAKAAAGTKVNVISRNGDQIVVSYLDSKQAIQYAKTSIQDEVTRHREEVQRRNAEKVAKEQQEKQARENAAKAESEKKAARTKLLSTHFSVWDGSHNELTKAIKKSMNDPDSYKHEETRYVDRGDYLIVITSYRGKNAFGGVVKNTATAKIDLDGNILEMSQGQ